MEDKWKWRGSEEQNNKDKSIKHCKLLRWYSYYSPKSSGWIPYWWVNSKSASDKDETESNVKLSVTTSENTVKL